MSSYLLNLCLAVAGVINLLPLVGILSAAKLEKLYGLDVADPNLEILLRHRAVLFGIVGALLFASIFKPSWQTPAITAGFISMISFILFTLLVNGYSGGFRHIVIADVIGIAALCVATFLISKT